jgi:Methylamine utilisation protein MauE/AhpC/TSA family
VSWALICARLLLAGVFVVAAVGKLLDPAAARRSLGEFGLPEVGSGVGLGVLIGSELAVAGMLLWTPSAQLGGLGAAVLLAVFTAAMLLALWRGERIQCQCFGALQSATVGPATVARNVVLAAAGGFVATQRVQPSITTWFSDRSAAQLAILGLSVALAAMTGLAFALWGRNRELRSAARAPATPAPRPVGSKAPAFRAVNLAGEGVTLRSLVRAGRPVALVFVHPGCGQCRELLPEVARWQISLERDLPVHVIVNGEPSRIRELVAEHGLANVVMQADYVVSKSFGIVGTPAAIVVTPGRTIGSRPALGGAAIEELIRRTLREPNRAAGLSRAA